MSEPTPGTVTLRLGEEDVVLTPSLPAAQAINRQFGGFTGAFARVSAADLDALTFIVAHGLGKADAAAQKDLASRIYATGIVTLAGPVSRFVGLLLNGGRAEAE